MRHQPMPLRAKLRIRLKPRNKSIAYRMAYLGARAKTMNMALKRPRKTFHFGLVVFHPMFKVRTSY